MFHELLNYNEEVTDALKSKKPIVALESTIISQGMPYPENLATAKIVEQLIREQGAVPATIAIDKGLIHIGISAKIMEH